VSSDIRVALRGVSRIKSIHVDPTSHHYIVLSILHRWLREVALPQAHGVMLDFGCGAQPYRELFSPRISRYIGADVAAAKDTKLDIEIAPDEPVPLEDASVDTILATQTLEHVFDFQFYLRECERLLRPGGVLIMTAPMQWRLHEAPYDYWRFTRYGLSEVASRCGLKVEIISPCGGVYALMGQILNSHLAEQGRGRGWIYRLVNRLALWLDRKIPDPDETINWHCILRKAANTVPRPEHRLVP